MESRRVHMRVGFTLVELMMVVALIAMMAMVAAPQLLSILTLTEHENEARHLVGYGRAAMAHTAMKHERIVIYIDMNTQEYWAASAHEEIMNSDGTRQTRGVNVSSYGERPRDSEEDKHEDQDWIPSDRTDLATAVTSINHARQDEALGEPIEEQDYPDEEDQEKVLNRQQDEMQDSFASMAQNTLFARAKRIEHDHDVFTKDEDSFSFRVIEEAEELEPEEAQVIEDPLLQRHALIETVMIQAVFLGDKKHSRSEKITDKNIVKIEISPLGLDTAIAIELINEDEEVLQVIWDPMTGNAWFASVEEKE